MRSYLIPKYSVHFLLNFDLVTIDRFQQARKFHSRVPCAALKPHRIQPGLRRCGIAIDMHVKGLMTVTRIEMKRGRSDDRDRRHVVRLNDPPCTPDWLRPNSSVGQYNSTGTSHQT